MKIVGNIRENFIVILCNYLAITKILFSVEDCSYNLSAQIFEIVSSWKCVFFQAKSYKKTPQQQFLGSKISSKKLVTKKFWNFIVN